MGKNDPWYGLTLKSHNLVGALRVRLSLLASQFGDWRRRPSHEYADKRASACTNPALHAYEETRLLYE